ncbi:MAG: class I SAM-dependent methyltransferase [Candidatus Omnitrophota bacterium]
MVKKLKNMLYFNMLHFLSKNRPELMRYRFCKGKGLEIGCGGKPIPNLNTIQIDICDNFNKFKYKVDYIHPCDDMPFFNDNQFDFVINSNVLEHFCNPIKAIKEWRRVTKNRGFLYLIVPDKRLWCPDRNKDSTSLEHLLKDYHDNVENYPSNWQQITEPSFQNRHYHFWEMKNLTELFDHLDGFSVVYSIETPDSVASQIQKDVADPSLEKMDYNWDLILKIQKNNKVLRLGHNFELAIQILK